MQYGRTSTPEALPGNDAVKMMQPTTVALNLLRALLALLVVIGPATAMEAQCRAPAAFDRLGSPLPHTQRALDAGGELVITAIGSSSTAGAGASTADSTYPAVLARELGHRLAKRSVRVVNRGVNGEEIANMRMRFDHDILESTPRPVLVIWQLGTNAVLRESGVAHHLGDIREGVRRLKEAGIDVILMDVQYAPPVLADPDHTDMNRMIAEIARTEGVGLFRRFDLMRHWSVTGQIPAAAMLAPDQLHLNDTGYRCIAKHLANAILLAARPAPLAGSPSKGAAVR